MHIRNLFMEFGVFREPDYPPDGMRDEGGD
jgi:hypothetical protein